MSKKLSVNDFMVIVDAFIQPEINANNLDNYRIAKERMTIVFQKLLSDDDNLYVHKENIEEKINYHLHVLSVLSKEILALYNVENNQLYELVDKRKNIERSISLINAQFKELLIIISQKC